MNALLLLAVLAAGRPLTARAPELPQDAAWINSKPYSMRMLRRRKVALVFFFHTADLHSLRALETVKTWQRRYEMHGLTVLGVHSPEYGFQKDPVYARRELRRFGVDFPVVLDAGRSIWDAYGNGGWPSFYLIDPNGWIVAEQLGEGRYPTLERDIRDLLRQAGYEPPEPRPVQDPSTIDCGGVSPHRSAGARGGKLLDLDGKNEGRLQVIGTAREGELATAGRWDAEPDLIRLAQGNQDQSAFVRVIYRGAQAFALLGPAPGGSKFWVRQDDLWLNHDNKGDDVELDDDGRSFVRLDRPKLAHLTTNGNDQMRQLTVTPDKRGSAVYGFAFNNRCLAVKLPQ